jgi:hypothetical protein
MAVAPPSPPGAARGIVGALLVLVSTIVIGLAARDLHGAGVDAELKKTTGKIESVTSERRRLLVRSDSPNAPTHETVIHVAFSYTVDGEPHVGTRYSMNEEHETIANDAAAQARLTALRVGSPVPVLYDPRDPSRAVLARRAAKGPLAGAIVASIGSLIGIGLLGSWWARRRRHAALTAVSEGDAVM